MKEECLVQEHGEEVMETEAVTSKEVADVEMETESPETSDSPGFGPEHDVSSHSFYPSKPSGCGLRFLRLTPRGPRSGLRWPGLSPALLSLPL